MTFKTKTPQRTAFSPATHQVEGVFWCDMRSDLQCTTLITAHYRPSYKRISDTSSSDRYNQQQSMCI